jgi:hypothetical protein
MPKTKKAPAYRRVAEGIYGDMLGATKVSKLQAEMERWDNDELFIVAHLSYLQLQQGEKIIALLEEIATNTSDMADAAVGDDEPEDSDEDSDDEDSEDEPEDSEDSDEGEPAEDSDNEGRDGSGGGEVIVMAPPEESSVKSEMLDHPQPQESSS